MKTYTKTFTIAVLITLIASNLLSADNSRPEDRQNQNRTWRAIHLFAPPHEKVGTLKQLITDFLAPMGINVLVLETNYSFAYRNHPELAKANSLTGDDAGELAQLCRKHGIRLIPMFNCLGHQSWAKNTFALLKKYPQFDETPHIPEDNPGIYCREWCPLHPEVNKIVFELMDELIRAFDADAFHVGMDEVFLIGDKKCPRCKDKDPGELFAKAINDYHQHLAGKHKIEMLMWGDRLLDANSTGYGEWEASKTGSHRAVEMIPKDVIICDWHYEPMADYPSVRFFQQKGLRVLPSTWKNPDAALALLKCSQKDATDKMLGMLFTNWSGRAAEELLVIFQGRQDSSKVSESTEGVAEAMKICLKELTSSPNTTKIKQH